jgi:penicillin amidase
LSSRGPSFPRRLLVKTGAVILIFLLCVLVTGWWLLHASLPQLDGAVAGLGVTATIERDAAGTPTIRAATRRELAFATGFAHAQDRFFQMDLLRRAGTGELAALLGASVVDTDRHLRVHDFRHVAQQVLAQMPQSDKELLDAYAAGVNAGLDALSVRPWEYLVLRSRPVRWTPQDSLLAAFSMYLSLNDSTGREELARAELHESLPTSLFDFLYPLGTAWDAPLVGGSWRAPDIPGPDVLDLRSEAARRAVSAVPGSKLPIEERPMPGSNSWAVAGTHAANGHALLANDMHLGLRLPNVWYRARLMVDGSATDPARDLIGVTLPGLPFLVVGSNRHVAWGFTNSYGDWTDLVTVEVDPADPQRYFVGATTEAFDVRKESIAVRGGSPVSIEVRATRWGPIVAEDSQGRPLALAWTAQEPRATNLRMRDLELATTVNDALSIANRAGIPVQNFVAADAAGHIGWTLMGQVPLRANYDSTLPASWREPGTGWVGWRESDEYPRIIDPPSGRLWTANARTLDAVAWLQFLGDGGYDLGARAAQIRDALFALPNATAADLAAIQLDDRALFLTRWRDLLLDVLGPASLVQHPDRKAARDLVERWSARATTDDVGYGIVRAFRLQVHKDVFGTLTATARLKFPQSDFNPSPQFEGSLWQVVTQRPSHLLDPRYATWEDALLAALDGALDSLKQQCGSLQQCTWGRQNVLAMRHPLSGTLPFASHWLDMSAQALPGDAAMPRVQNSHFGASERLVVAPGHEEQGTFQMPGGPVDHPLSPFYGAGHDAWVRGETVPLLPGKTTYTLQLKP